MSQVDVVLLGASFTGYTAAIELAKKGHSVVIFDWLQERGMRGLESVDPTRFNQREITGQTSATWFETELKRLGVKEFTVSFQKIRLVDEEIIFEENWGVPETHTRTIIYCPYDINIDPRLDLPNHEELVGYGVSWCAWSDGFFFKDKPVAVMGDDDWAFEQALLAAGFASQVTIFCAGEPQVRRQSLKSKVLASPIIRIVSNIEVTGFEGDHIQGVTGLRYNRKGKSQLFPCSGAFWAKLDPRRTLSLEKWKLLMEVVPETYVLPAGTEVGIPYTNHAALVEDGFRVAEAARERILELA